MTEISIRPLADPAEYKQVDEIQLTAWDRDERSIVPWEFMRSAQFSGGALLGAFDPAQPGRLIGYVFGVLGLMPDHSRLQMYSHQLAVRPGYQGASIGRRLKLAQRAFCLERQVARIIWTFDPLVARNGWLNIGRLGGIVRTFLPDWYGDNQHRFMLEWWLTSSRVETRLRENDRPLDLKTLLAGGARIANPAPFNAAGFPVPAPIIAALEADRIVLLEIPADLPAQAGVDPGLAARWRAQARLMFSRWFGDGYAITDIVRHQDGDGRRRVYYLLEKNVIANS